MPAHDTKYLASSTSPASVRICQRFVASSKRAPTTRVLKRMSLRRSQRSAMKFRYASVSGWAGKRSLQFHSFASSSENQY